MRVLEDHHSRSCGLFCWFKRKKKNPVAIFFFLNVNIAFKVYIFNNFGNIICLMSQQVTTEDCFVEHSFSRKLS